MVKVINNVSVNIRALYVVIAINAIQDKLQAAFLKPLEYRIIGSANGRQHRNCQHPTPL
jgi:hypothetical protein